ncbi:MAG: hypothetical protein U9P36_09600 [Thermodesulfobacteriota bacterium]|nr:hypothetical protein [Thermodesulfobacteriota bacterium]
MKTPRPTPSDRKQDKSGLQVSCPLLTPMDQGSGRFISCLVIGILFVLMNIAIVIYLFWPTIMGKDPAQQPSKPAGVEKKVTATQVDFCRKLLAAC